MFSAAVRKYAVTQSQSQRDNSGTAHNTAAAVSSASVGRTKNSKLADIPARTSKKLSRSHNYRSSSNSNSNNNNHKQGGYNAPPCSSHPSVAVNGQKATQAAAESEVPPGYYLVPQSFTFTVAPGSQPPMSQLTYDSALAGPVAHSGSIDGGYHESVINTNRSSNQATMSCKPAHDERNNPPMGRHSLSFFADQSSSKYSNHSKHSTSASLPPPERDGTGSVPTIRKSFWTREQLERANIASKVDTLNATGAQTILEATVKKQTPLPPLSHPNLLGFHHQHRSSEQTFSNSEDHKLSSSRHSDKHREKATLASDRPPLGSHNDQKPLLFNPLARRSLSNNNSSSVASYTNSTQRSISSVRAASTTDPSSLHPSRHTEMKRVLHQTKLKMEEKNHELQVQLSNIQKANEFMHKKVHDATTQKNQDLQEHIDKKMEETQEILCHKIFEQHSSLAIMIQNEVKIASSKIKNDVEVASAAASSKIRNEIEEALVKIQLQTMHGVSELEESCAAKNTELHTNIRSIKHELLKSVLGDVEKHCGRWFTSFLSSNQGKEHYSQSSEKSHRSESHETSIPPSFDNKENNGNYHKGVDIQLTPANKTGTDTSRRIFSSNKKQKNRNLESFQNHRVNTTRPLVSASKTDFHTSEVLSPETSHSNMNNFAFASDSQRDMSRRQSEHFFSCKKTNSSQQSLLSSSQESTHEIILNSKQQHHKLPPASHDDSTQQWLISTPASRTLETDRKINRGSQSIPKQSPFCPLILTSIKNRSHFSELTTTPTISQLHSGDLQSPIHSPSKRKAEDITHPPDLKRLVRGKDVMKKSRRGFCFSVR